MAGLPPSESSYAGWAHPTARQDRKNWHLSRPAARLAERPAAAGESMRGARTAGDTVAIGPSTSTPANAISGSERRDSTRSVPIGLSRRDAQGPEARGDRQARTRLAGQLDLAPVAAHRAGEPDHARRLGWQHDRRVRPRGQPTVDPRGGEDHPFGAHLVVPPMEDQSQRSPGAGHDRSRPVAMVDRDVDDLAAVRIGPGQDRTSWVQQAGDEAMVSHVPSSTAEAEAPMSAG